jgi:hypothetical protein
MKYLKLFELSLFTWRDAFNNELKRVNNLKTKGGIYEPTRINKFAAHYCTSLLKEINKIYDNKYKCEPFNKVIIKTHSFDKENKKLKDISNTYIDQIVHKTRPNYLGIRFLEKKLDKSISKTLIKITINIFLLEDDYYQLDLYYFNSYMRDSNIKKNPSLYFDQLSSLVLFIKNINSLL